MLFSLHSKGKSILIISGSSSEQNIKWSFLTLESDSLRLVCSKNVNFSYSCENQGKKNCIQYTEDSGKIFSKQDVLCHSHRVRTWQWKTQTHTHTHTHTNTQRKHKLYKNASMVFKLFLLNFQSFTASFGKGRHSTIVLLTLFLNILKRWWSFVDRLQSHERTVLLFFLQINTLKICVVLAPQRSSHHRVTVAVWQTIRSIPPPPPHTPTLPGFGVIRAKNVKSIHNLSRNDCRPGKLIKLILAFSLYSPQR